MLSQPSLKLANMHLASLIETDDKREGFSVVEIQLVAINSQERRRDRYRDTLVAINERMILRQALPKRSSFLNHVFIVSGLGSRQRCF